MNDVTWYVQALIWISVAIVFGAAYVQVFRGGVVNFVRVVLLKKAPLPDRTGGETQRPRDGGANDQRR